MLNAAKIPFIPLKGSVIRKYYPEPWMRTSCDIDILIHEHDLDRTVKLLTGEWAYRQEGKGSHDVGLFLESGVHLELHYSLIEKAHLGNAETVLQSVWGNSKSADSTTEYAMTDAMFYCYNIAHMAKHFQNGG